MTQRAIAEALGFSDRSGHITVAQIEARTDWLVSSIAAYVRACGGTAELRVRVSGQELTFNLG